MAPCSSPLADDKVVVVVLGVTEFIIKLHVLLFFDKNKAVAEDYLLSVLIIFFYGNLDDDDDDIVEKIFYDDVDVGLSIA